MLERRTDLAMEAAQGLQSAARTQGVLRAETVEEGVTVTTVEIATPQAAKVLGKPKGRYVTLDLGPVRRREAAGFQRACRILAAELAKMLPQGEGKEEGPVLVAALGNRDITPDAVGPLAHGHLLVTRHLVDQLPEAFGGFRPVAAVAAGVLGDTGVESADLIRAVVEQVRPVCVVAIDALAAQSMKRLCTTVQLCDTGVAPGSGVGNSRAALNRETLGVPVIAVGVPTVVDAGTLARDVLEEAGKGELEPEALGTGGLFVTPRDIDQRVAECAKLIGYAVSLALQPGLSQEDLEGLVE